MTLLWLDGFESYGTTTNAVISPSTVLERKYTGAASDSDGFTVEVGRISGRGLKPSNFGFVQTPAINTDATIIVGAAFKFDDFDETPVFIFVDGGTVGIKLHFSQGELYFSLSSVIIGNTTGLHLTPGVWYYIETKLLVDNTVGTYEVRVGGVNVLSDTGVDTQGAGGNAYYDRLHLEGDFDNNWVIDDLYICNGVGSNNNDFLGDIRVLTTRPDGDDTTNFTTSTPSANHFENVDEAEQDDDTSYVESSTSGQRELYDYSALTGLGTILGLMLNFVTNDASNDDDFQHLINSNGTEENSANVNINDSDYLTYTYISEQDPDIAGAWTQSTVNAAKFGVELP